VVLHVKNACVTRGHKEADAGFTFPPTNHGRKAAKCFV
jgi:hypothetical protein